MKKYIGFLIILSFLFFGASKAQAITMEDLQKQIQGLGEQISSLKSQLVGMAINLVAPTTTTNVPTTTTSPSSVISMPSAVTSITKGATSTEVTAIQSVLKSEGYFPKTINPTGYYGDITAKAVSDYQKANSLPVTGTVDTTTLTKLNSTIKTTTETKGLLADACLAYGKSLSDLKGYEVKYDSKGDMVYEITKGATTLTAGGNYELIEDPENSGNALLVAVGGSGSTGWAFTCGCHYTGPVPDSTMCFSNSNDCEPNWNLFPQQLTCQGSCTEGSCNCQIISNFAD